VSAAMGWDLPFVAFFSIAFAVVFWTARHERAGKAISLRCTLYATATLATVALTLGWKFQPPVTLNGGLGFDGLRYRAMYDRFLGVQTRLPFDFPYSQRIGVPFLAAKIPLPARGIVSRAARLVLAFCHAGIRVDMP